jgi:hypothetical protein
MSFGIPVRNGLGVGLLASTFLSSLRIGGRPALFLNFVNTTALDSRITFTRTTTATVTGSNGAIQSSAINEPRFDYDPVTLASRGLLIEEQRINLLLNSLIDGTSLSTQSVTVAAVAHTISFYGTGTITLTGASVATVTGTGVYPNRRTLTFTPIVGILVCTVTGSVQYAQLEAGGFATSFIPTAGSAGTRAPDVAQITGTNFSSWYNQTEGTIIASASTFSNAATDKFITNINNNGFPNRILMNFTATPVFSASLVSNSVSQVSGTNGTTIALNTPVKMGFATIVNNFAFSRSGLAPTTDNLGVMPVTVDRLWIGSAVSSAFLNGHMRSVTYYNTRLPNATLQALTV